MLNKYTHLSHSYILICRYKLVFSRVKQAFITLLAQSVSRICVGLNFSKFRNKMPGEENRENTTTRSVESMTG